MRYALGFRDDGWLIVDRDDGRIAVFAGCPMKALSRDEAETMLGLIVWIDEASARARRAALG
jgi:hypothetical protein